MLLISFPFGLLAWGLAAFAAREHSKTAICVTGSFICCCISAVSEFFDLRGRAFRGDYIGIEDTIDAVIFGVIVMMVVTVLLNFMALTLKTNQTKE